MIRAAIVEDDSQYSRLLERYFLRWCEEKGLRGEARVFPDPVLFLDPYAADYQIVFMDIQMPHINGMDAARRLRELDDTVLLLFVTSMAQYAIQGYAVRAFDYVLKPLSYPDFVLKMSRVPPAAAGGARRGDRARHRYRQSARRTEGYPLYRIGQAPPHLSYDRRQRPHGVRPHERRRAAV